MVATLSKWHLETPAGKRRARALGIPFEGAPGPFNAITDVAGVEVGYATLIAGEGPLVRGKGPVRTGVTAILPRGRDGVARPVFAGCHSLNGNGEMTGYVWLEECGRLDGPITITNTHSCGLARDATLEWLVERGLAEGWHLPVAAETFDGFLNDVNGFHVRAEHVRAALDGARGGPIEEGSVGGGTGMICYEFKGGSGTSSRLASAAGESWSLGAFVQANFGARPQLTIAGVPIGRHLTEQRTRKPEQGSVIAVVATDAPLLPHQLKRLARRIGLGIGRTGSIAAHGSGDIFLAFSTANEAAFGAEPKLAEARFVPDRELNPLFEAVVQSIDEAVINALIANETMTGRDGNTAHAIDHDALVAVLERYGRRDGAGG
jgi:L-aminopeptidase/D-esterase-like protein